MTDEDEARRIGAARGASHAVRSPRLFEDKDLEDVIGAAGELAFARMFGLPTGHLVREDGSGDGGVDFRVWIAGQLRTIDVKTYRNALHLLVKESEIGHGADIYVLADYERGHPVFLGWEHRSIMAMMPVSCFSPGISSHYRLADELRPMAQLANLLALRVEDKETHHE